MASLVYGSQTYTNGMERLSKTVQSGSGFLPWLFFFFFFFFSFSPETTSIFWSRLETLWGDEKETTTCFQDGGGFFPDAVLP